MTTRAEKMEHMRLEVARLESTMDELKNPDAGTLVDEKAQEHRRRHGGTYAEALDAVLKADPDLHREFLESFNTVNT